MGERSPIWGEYLPATSGLQIAHSALYLPPSLWCFVTRAWTQQCQPRAQPVTLTSVPSLSRAFPVCEGTLSFLHLVLEFDPHRVVSRTAGSRVYLCPSETLQHLAQPRVQRSHPEVAESKKGHKRSTPLASPRVTWQDLELGPKVRLTLGTARDTALGTPRAAGQPGPAGPRATAKEPWHSRTALRCQAWPHGHQVPEEASASPAHCWGTRAGDLMAWGPWTAGGFLGPSCVQQP